MIKSYREIIWIYLASTRRVRLTCHILVAPQGAVLEVLLVTQAGAGTVRVEAVISQVRVSGHDAQVVGGVVQILLGDVATHPVHDLPQQRVCQEVLLQHRPRTEQHCVAVAYTKYALTGL